MIDRNHDLPVSQQAQMLLIGRGTVYYLPRATSPGATPRILDGPAGDFPGVDALRGGRVLLRRSAALSGVCSRWRCVGGPRCSP